MASQGRESVELVEANDSETLTNAYGIDELVPPEHATVALPPVTSREQTIVM